MTTDKKIFLDQTKTAYNEELGELPYALYLAENFKPLNTDGNKLTSLKNKVSEIREQALPSNSANNSLKN